MGKKSTDAARRLAAAKLSASLTLADRKKEQEKGLATAKLSASLTLADEKKPPEYKLIKLATNDEIISKILKVSKLAETIISNIEKTKAIEAELAAKAQVSMGGDCNSWTEDDVGCGEQLD